ncbi:MAG TPA: hypothetical protein VGU25_14980 [Acidobacteriaceae bacterium]|nr:hypothetical protein [Acidobacteriaceae bacterium]
MLKLVKIAITALAITALVPSLGNAATRATWSPWMALPNANGVEVSFSQVNDNMCTWMIRNSGSTTLRSLEFTYTYSPAIQQGQATGRDLIMEPLRPGRQTGGATQFGAETGKCPSTLVVSHIEWGK